MSSTENDFTKIKKEQLALKAIEFDDLDIDNMDLTGPVKKPEQNAVQKQIADLKSKPPEKVPTEKVKSDFELKRLALRNSIDIYDDFIVKGIDNKLTFMTVEQSFSTSYIPEIIRSLKRKKNFDPAWIISLRPLIEEYLNMLDSRYSLYKRTLLNPNVDNLHYANNLYLLDQAYLKNGFSQNKCSVLTPFHVMEMFDRKNLKKYHLASLIDDLEEDRIPDNAGVDDYLPPM